MHANAPHHRAAAERVLGPQADKAAMARAVAAWAATDLETSVIGEGGCAAEMRSLTEWAAHPQGRATMAGRLIDWAEGMNGNSIASGWTPRRDRPLEGLRVLDLTRVLAGPVASRFLAGYGAEVLRIDPPHWDEPGLAPEMTLGKRCARLDLRDRAGRQTFEGLLSRADVLLHGYRPGAPDGLGYDTATRRRIAPGLVDVSLNAYGWAGPWASRRGFDSLVQMSAGIAQAGMERQGADMPAPLPVQALDHATGYLMAAAAVHGITRRMTDGTLYAARLSLAQTARVLVGGGTQPSSSLFAPETADDLSPFVEQTAWGEARRLLAPAIVEGAPMHWDHPARPLGSAAPAWR